MAQKSLPKRPQKMNLSSRQVALFQKIIYVGGQMSGMIQHYHDRGVLPKNAIKYAKKWADLMVDLAKTLL